MTYKTRQSKRLRHVRSDTVPISRAWLSRSTAAQGKTRVTGVVRNNKGSLQTFSYQPPQAVVQPWKGVPSYLPPGGPWGRGPAPPRVQPAEEQRRVGFFRYVDTRLRSIALEASSVIVEPRTLPILRDFLGKVASDSVLFPHIAPDGDGGVVAEWLAGGDRVQIGVAADIELFVFFADNTGNVRINEDFAQDAVSTELIRDVSRLLSQLTRRVNILNPDWRKLFTTR